MTNKEKQLSLKTLKAMVKQGIGHGILQKVVDNLENKTKKSAK